ncbi:MAG: tRNA lysidine(34) synthetase TilS [Verrucomicrobiota bacterium]
MPAWSEWAKRLAAQTDLSRHSWPDGVEGTLGIACSGGADSVYLLLQAWVHYFRSETPLVVLHLNHGLRGPEAKADADFVAGMAKDLGLPLVDETLSKTPENASEAWMRQQRLDFFQRTGCSVILLAHHRDDIAETLLMRLARGSGTEGLASPQAIQYFANGLCLSRPLLSMSKQEILKALVSQDIPWREDRSNVNLRYLRNRIRHEVYPRLLDASMGAAARGLQRSHQLLSEDAEALNQLLDELQLDIQAGQALECGPLQRQPLALWRRAFQRWLLLHQLTDVLSAASVDHLLEAAFRGENIKVSAGNKRYVVFQHELLRLEQEQPLNAWLPVRCSSGVSLFLPTGYRLSIELVPLKADLRNRILAGAVEDSYVAYLEAKQVLMPLTIRRWQEGDRYRPLGAPGTRKIQDIFTDAKLATKERKTRPVVCDAQNKICWCPGFAPAEFAKITPGTASALRLTYRVS